MIGGPDPEFGMSSWLDPEVVIGGPGSGFFVSSRPDLQLLVSAIGEREGSRLSPSTRRFGDDWAMAIGIGDWYAETGANRREV